MIVRNLLFICAATTLTLGYVMPISANDSAPTAFESDSLTEIVVTARRVEERLQDVPISISVFNQQQLEERNVVSTADLGTYAPSVTADTRFGTDNTTFAIRGFTQEIRTTPSVGVYFADVVMPRGGGALVPAGDGAGPGAFFDLQNVQILKGPQGTLFGRNTTGGAVLLVPQKPTDEFGGYIEGTYGNYDLERYQAVVNTPVSSRVRLRAGFDREQREGYLRNTSGIGPNRFDNINYVTGRVSLDVDITDNLENYTVASFSRSSTFGALSQIFACNPSPSDARLTVVGALLCPQQLARQQGANSYAVQNNYPNPSNLAEQWQVINDLTWKAADWVTVRNINSYAQFKSTTRSDFFGDNLSYPAGFGAFSGLPLNLTNSLPPAGYPTNDQSTITEELRLQGEAMQSKLSWQTGGYLEVSNPLHPVSSLAANDLTCLNQAAQQCIDTLGFINSAAAGPLLGEGLVVGGEGRTIDEVRYRDIGLYAQTTYAFTDKLKATTGVRYTWDRTDAQGQQIAYSFSAPLMFAPWLAPTAPNARCIDPSTDPATANDPVNGCKLHFGETSQKPTWVVDLDYSPFSDAMGYLKYARGYRQGGVVPEAPAGGANYGPETVNTYEIGLKTAFHGEHLQGIFNLAAFYNDFLNQQVQVAYFPTATPGASPTTGIESGARSRIYGAEVDSALEFSKSFRLEWSGAYLNSKLKDLPPLPLLPSVASTILVINTSLPGKDLPFTPRYKSSLAGTYKLPISDTYGTVSASAIYTYTDGMLTNATSPFGVIAPTNLLNLDLNWKSVMGKPFDVSLFATNVTNQLYSTYVVGYWQSFGLEGRNLGEPRVFGARLRYHW
jgi:iron complex outermembrane recepter protein